MAQPKDFLDFLVDPMGRSRRVNNGVVDAVSTPTPLPTTPDGWQDKSIKYQRNISRYYGMFRTFTNPLKWVREGARIMRDRMYKFGTEDVTYLVINKLDKSFGGGWVHRFFYKGELDLTKFDDDETHVTCNIMEGDLSKLFKANESTVYELDVNVPEAVIVKMDGLKLKQSASYLITDGIPDSGLKPNIPELVLIGSESIKSIGAKSTTRTVALNSASGGDVFPTKQNFLTPSGVTDLTINWNFGLKLELVGIGALPAPHYLFQLLGYDKDGNRVVNQNIEDYTDDPLLFYQHHVFTGSATVAIPANVTELYLRSTVTTLPNNTLFTYDNDGTVDIEYFYTHPTTFIKALPAAYVCQKLLDKITNNGPYTFSSTYLSGEWDNLLITSGDAIRGFENAKLKTSWVDFYDSYNVPCNISQSMGNTTVSIEKKEAAFGSTIRQNLGQVKGFTKKAATDFQYAGVKIGYPNTDTEAVNGRDEFNVTHTYTSPVTRVSKVFEVISKYFASMYVAEITRINLEGKKTTDDNVDSQVGFLHVEKSPTIGTGDEPAVYHKLYRKTYDSITGLISPETAFNIELSPKRCLLRHGNFWRSIFYWQEAGYFVFQTSDKNAELKTVLGAEVIEEKGNVNIGSLAAPLFIPILFEFESPIGEGVIQTMEQNPSDTFQFEDGDVTGYGFPMDIGIQPANNPAQNTILLCSPQTDLTKFIHG